MTASFHVPSVHYSVFPYNLTLMVCVCVCVYVFVVKVMKLKSRCLEASLNAMPRRQMFNGGMDPPILKLDTR